MAILSDYARALGPSIAVAAVFVAVVWPIARYARATPHVRRLVWWSAALYALLVPALILIADSIEHNDRLTLAIVAWMFPGSVFAAAWGRACKSWSLFTALTFTSLLAPGFTLAFESATHGRFYIQSEANALLLTFAVAFATWHLPVAVCLYIWARAHRIRAPIQRPCPRCTYELAGLAVAAACPECGHISTGPTHS